MGDIMVVSREDGSGNASAVGYISLGSLSDAVKPVKVNGAAATSEAVLDGTYPIQRPFNIVYKDKLSDTAKDFVAVILSKEGQEVVAGKSYVPSVRDATAYQAGSVSGKIASLAQPQ